MRTIAFYIIIILSIYAVRCASTDVTYDRVKNELIDTAASIESGKEGISVLDNRKIGRKGYYYTIKNDGSVSYHPKKNLIGLNFARFQFIKKILERRNGCMTYNIDGTRRYIFFREIDPDEILCLAIESSEFDEPVNECSVE